MNLLQIRTQAVKLSGRYDLVVDDSAWADNGMDFFINAASRWLDRLSEHHRSYSRVFRTLAAGEYLVEFQHCRDILKVGIATADTFVGWLERKELKELRETSGYKMPFGDITAGEGLYFTPCYLRITDTEAADYSGFEDWVDESSDWMTYNAIIVTPPADEDYVLEIHGKFFSAEMSDNTDENFWSVTEPQILVKATLRELEVFARNSEGQKDWERAIFQEMLDLEKDYVELDYGYVNIMRG